MFRKSRRLSKGKTQHLSGDGKEVLTELQSPNETIHVPKPPPTLADLYSMMNTNEVHLPRENIVRFAKLAPHLGVLTEGLQTLTRTGEEALEALLSPNVETTVVRDIDTELFEAICGFLLHRRHVARVQRAIKKAAIIIRHPALSQQYRSIFLVWRLLEQRQSGHAIIWNKLVQALVDSACNDFELPGRLGYARRAVETFHLVERALQDIDDRDVILSPHTLHRVLTLAQRCVEGMRAISAASPRHKVAADVLEHVRQLTEHRFYATLGGSTVKNTKKEARPLSQSADLHIPSLNVAPSPAVLHAFTRTLGCLHDFNGICDLAFWMRKYWPELSCPVLEYTNGKRLLRKTVVAMRVYLEGRQFGRGQGLTDNIRADEELLRKVKDVVNSVSDWEGWPGDAEVNDYVRQDREQLLRSRQSDWQV
jgi:hypothetical protein